LKLVGCDSSVGIATRYGLDGPGIESRWGARFSAPVQTGPEAHSASCTMSTGPLWGIKSDRDATLTPHPLLVPWSRKSRAIPLLPLWGVRPVQSLSACTTVHCTFYLTSDYVTTTSIPFTVNHKSVVLSLSAVCSELLTASLNKQSIQLNPYRQT